MKKIAAKSEPVMDLHGALRFISSTLPIYLEGWIVKHKKAIPQVLGFHSRKATDTMRAGDLLCKRALAWVSKWALN